MDLAVLMRSIIKDIKKKNAYKDYSNEDVGGYNIKTLEGVRIIRSYDGIYWKIPDCSNKRAIVRPVIRVMHKAVSRLTRFLFYKQNEVNNATADAIEALQQQVNYLQNRNEYLESELLRFRSKNVTEVPDYSKDM